MSATTSLSTDPVPILSSLTIEQLQQRLDYLEFESKAVRVLLREAAARKRLQERRAREEATCVS